jgi:hypothetical protein
MSAGQHEDSKDKDVMGYELPQRITETRMSQSESVLQTVTQWFDGASQHKQATKVQWYSGSVGCRGVSKRPVVQWFNGVCVTTCYSTRRKASRCKRNQA